MNEGGLGEEIRLENMADRCVEGEGVSVDLKENLRRKPVDERAIVD